jgi:hypothetical protein
MSATAGTGTSAQTGTASQAHAQERQAECTQARSMGAVKGTVSGVNERTAHPERARRRQGRSKFSNVYLSYL